MISTIGNVLLINYSPYGAIYPADEKLVWKFLSFFVKKIGQSVTKLFA